MKDYWIIFKEEFLNKSVVITVTAHWTLVVIAFLFRGDLRWPFHFYYESILLKIITLLDFPALTVAETMGFPVSVSITESAISNVVGTIIVVTLQWIVIGYLIGKILSLGKGNDSSGPVSFD